MTGDDSGLSVLVVDDDAAILRTLLLTLKSLGCRVVGESGGEAALAAVEKQAPDLLLTDMRMEGMSGVELTAAALERRPDLVCVLMTAFASYENAVEAIKAGAYDYLPKPFSAGELDVLVSTTIIETGLDISNVNTMIIHDSDNLGLSQLYQLRGRVGRSNRNAYAFLMYKRDKMLKEVAEKRLAAIKEFTDLGSGFKIAMRDLEIRGAGNLLGLSQHGHMEAVGYDLYCKMLNEAVQNLKGIHTAVDFATVIDLDVDAYIPAEYIVNETQKLDIYKRIAGIETIKERDEMKDELLDRFGNIPKAVDNLLRIALIRMAAHGLDMTEIKGKNERITFNFRPDAKIDPRKIPDFLKKHKDELSFTAYGNPFFTYKYKKTGLVETDAELLMGRTEELLEEMKELVLETEPVQND